MRTIRRSAVMGRAFVAVIATLVVVAGVTFASLQSQQAVLRGNTIQTAVASLQLSPNDVTYSNSIDGYVFGNLVPGGQALPINGYPVYLKNVGTTPLALKLSVGETFTNTDQVDASKVHVILAPISGGVPQNMLLSDLIAANVSGGVALSQGPRVLPGQSIGYTIQVMLEGDAVRGASATLSNIDFNFGATSVN